MSFLPEGLSLVDKEREPIPVQITRADPSGPPFIVYVNPLSVGEFKDISKQLQRSSPKGFRPGSKAADKWEMEFAERYCKRVVVDWSGLTGPNFDDINAGSLTIGEGEAKQAFYAAGGQIEHSLEAAIYLHTNTWPETYGDKIFEALQKGAEDQEADEAARKND